MHILHLSERRAALYRSHIQCQRLCSAIAVNLQCTCIRSRSIEDCLVYVTVVQLHLHCLHLGAEVPQLAVVRDVEQTQLATLLDIKSAERVTRSIYRCDNRQVVHYNTKVCYTHVCTIESLQFGNISCVNILCLHAQLLSQAVVQLGAHCIVHSLVILGTLLVQVEHVKYLIESDTFGYCSVPYISKNEVVCNSLHLTCNVDTAIHCYAVHKVQLVVEFGINLTVACIHSHRELGTLVVINPLVYPHQSHIGSSEYQFNRLILTIEHNLAYIA